MSRRLPHGMLLLMGAVLVLVVVQRVAGTAALLGCPALALLLPLLGGRYVGEERLARLARRLAPRGRLRPARPGTSLPRAPRLLPRGGRLIAARLAERGPPACAAAR